MKKKTAREIYLENATKTERNQAILGMYKLEVPSVEIAKQFRISRQMVIRIVKRGS